MNWRRSSFDDVPYESPYSFNLKKQLFEPSDDEEKELRNDFKFNEEGSHLVFENKIGGEVGSFDNFILILYGNRTNIVACRRDSLYHLQLCDEGDALTIKSKSEEECTDILSMTHVSSTRQILTTHYRWKSILLWDIFPEVKLAKKIDIYDKDISIYDLILLEDHSFLCVCGDKNSLARGRLFHCDDFLEPNRPEIRELYDFKMPFLCIHQLKSPELRETHFAIGGGNCAWENSIKLVQLDEKRNFENVIEFDDIYRNDCTSLSSYTYERSSEMKLKEIIVSGSKDHRIIFWNLEGRAVKVVDTKVDIFCMEKFPISFQQRDCSAFFLGGEVGEVYVMNTSRRKEYHVQRLKEMKRGNIVRFQRYGDDKLILLSSSGSLFVYSVVGFSRSCTSRPEDDDGERIKFIQNDEESVKSMKKLFV